MHFLVARLVQPFANVAFQLAIQDPTVGMPEHHARRFLLEMEQVHRTSKLAVIALLRFFQPVEVGPKLLGIRPSGAVDALQHLVAGVAPPVGARQLGQLECPQVTGVRDMRATAHVDVFLVVVQRDFLAFRNLVDDLHLVGLATSLKYFTGPIAGHHFAQHIVILRKPAPVPWPRFFRDLPR